MIITLGIDPATHGTAASLFFDHKLVAAGYAPNPVKDGDPARRAASSALAAFKLWEKWDHELRHDSYIQQPHNLVMELPPIYQPGKGNKGDQNDIVVPLAMVDGALAALFPNSTTHCYKPSAWKGQTTKPKNVAEEVVDGKIYVIKARVADRLTPEERARVDWTASVEHSWDVADAIGVGMHHLGRFARKRAFARE